RYQELQEGRQAGEVRAEEEARSAQRQGHAVQRRAEAEVAVVPPRLALLADRPRRLEYDVDERPAGVPLRGRAVPPPEAAGPDALGVDGHLVGLRVLPLPPAGRPVVRDGDVRRVEEVLDQERVVVWQVDLEVVDDVLRVAARGRVDVLQPSGAARRPPRAAGSTRTAPLVARELPPVVVALHVAVPQPSLAERRGPVRADVVGAPDGPAVGAPPEDERTAEDARGDDLGRLGRVRDVVRVGQGVPLLAPVVRDDPGGRVGGVPPGAAEATLLRTLGSLPAGGLALARALAQNPTKADRTQNSARDRLP
ncbi:hypothetical protein THAOC_21479, partial [Thalassiosira oceanica]